MSDIKNLNEKEIAALLKMADISENAYEIFIKIKRLQDSGQILLNESQSSEINQWIRDFTIVAVQEQIALHNPTIH